MVPILKVWALSLPSEAAPEPEAAGVLLLLPQPASTETAMTPAITIAKNFFFILLISFTLKTSFSNHHKPVLPEKYSNPPFVFPASYNKIFPVPFLPWSDKRLPIIANLPSTSNIS